MSHEDRMRLINRLAGDLAVLASTFDTRGFNCSKCGATRRMNWSEHQMWEQVDSMREKLGRIQAKLDDAHHLRREREAATTK